MSDAREEMRDAVRRGLRSADAIGDPDQIEDYVDGVMEALVETEVTGQVGWFIVNGLGHVYAVERCQMTDASHADYSRWDVRTREDK